MRNRDGFNERGKSWESYRRGREVVSYLGSKEKGFKEHESRGRANEEELERRQEQKKDASNHHSSGDDEGAPGMEWFQHCRICPDNGVSP